MLKHVRSTATQAPFPAERYGKTYGKYLAFFWINNTNFCVIMY